MKWPFSCVHVPVSEGRERVCRHWHFLVVLPQPISFCILKKQANCSAWFIFPHLIPHFLPRHFLIEFSFHSSVRSLQSCWSRRLTKTRPLATSRKIQKLVQQTFRQEFWTNVHVLWNLHPRHTIIWWCNVCCFEFSTIDVGMYDFVDACSVHLSEEVYFA